MEIQTDPGYKARLDRFNDAVALRKPDRVPTVPMFQNFPARYAGLTYKDIFYDLDAWLAANEKAIVDYDLDVYWTPSTAVAASGDALDAVGMRQIQWPGGDLDPMRPFQFVEGEYMKADEYDEFLSDPSDWTIRKYMPRIYGKLEGLGMLPPLITWAFGYGGVGAMGLLAAPQIVAAAQAVAEASQHAARYAMGYAQFEQKMTGLGYPSLGTAVTVAPFDFISDMLRGMRGSMLDMYRCPDKLLAAQEKVFPLLLGLAIGGAQMGGNPRVFIPLHRGADGFMSNEQFERFYWPLLKALFLGLIDAGLTPCPFFEGVYDQRLQYLKELPPGKMLGCFDRSDMVKVKRELGDVMAIAGGMPITLLQAGTPEQVRDMTRRLIDTLGVDGGYMMFASSVLDEADPELVRVWLETTREYGVY